MPSELECDRENLEFVLQRMVDSLDVKFEGKNVARAFELMLHNDKNTPPFPVMQGPIVAMGAPPGKPKCICCEEEV